MIEKFTMLSYRNFDAIKTTRLLLAQYNLFSLISSFFLNCLVLREFIKLLRKQATVEVFTVWLNLVVEHEIIKVFTYGN